MYEKKVFSVRLLLGLVVLACCVSLMAGCQGRKQQYGAGLKVRESTFKVEMNKGIEATREGDLEMARLYVERARPNAKTFEQKRMVESMEKLISGAEAMMEGNVSQAKNDWAEIPDMHLARQVRINAEAVMGVEVPAIPKYREDEK